MENRYSVYDAKAHFSELIRRARNNERVIVTSHGKPVIELVPYRAQAHTMAEIVASAEARGVLEAGTMPTASLQPVAHRKDALAHFLQDRE